MSSSCVPLRWESTGERWWYVSPIDLAATNGYYDIVRELLHLDINVLMKLTSLRRIRRLESVWDDDKCFVQAAKCRAFVARRLLLECETKNNRNRLIRAGYGGWLLYTAAAAGDIGFVQELFERDALLVFGEGEYGITDILYAAARSKSTEVFKAIFECALSLAYLVGGGGEIEVELGSGSDDISVFRWEIVNRAVFAAARGGNLEVLKELLGDSSDVLAYRDRQGATILHASSGRGQVEVVKDLVASFNIIESRDNQGNTAVHVAAFRGHLPVVESLISASPSLSYLRNNDGNTFLHMAVAGFRTPGFQRLERHMELVKKLIFGNMLKIQEIMNIQNNNGRTALHEAVIGTIHSNLVELLMTVPSIDINIRDINSMTPLDLLRGGVRSASSNILIKQFVAAGGISNLIDSGSSDFSSKFKIQSGSGNSPGTSFRITDSEIFLYTGIEAPETHGRANSCSSSGNSELSYFEPNEESDRHAYKKKPSSSLNVAVRRLMIMLRLSRRKDKKRDNDCQDLTSTLNGCRVREDIPAPLRKTFSKGASSLQNNKRTVAVRASVPSPATKKKFAASLMHGVFRAMPHLAVSSLPQTPISPLMSSQVSSPMSETQKSIVGDYDETSRPTFSLNTTAYSHTAESSSYRSGFMIATVRNKCLRLRSKGLAMESSSGSQLYGRFVPPVG